MRARRLELAVVAAAFAVAGVRLFAYVDRYAVEILFMDEWDYLGGLFHGASAWQLFSWQHGPPRLGLGLLLIQAVFALTHWSSRALAFVAAGTYLVAALCAVWLKRRVAGPLSLFDASIPLLFLELGHYETWAGASDPAHGPLPLLLAVLFALALTVRNRWGGAVVAGAVACLAMYTGFALFIAFVALLIFPVLAWRAGRRAAPWLLAFVATLACVGSFFVGYRFMPAVDCFVFPAPHPLDYLRFVGLFLGHAVQWDRLGGAGQWVTIGLTSMGIALAALSFALTLRGPEPRPLWLAVFSLIAFALLFGADAAVGRVCLGVASAVASRYVPYAIAAWFAAYLALHALRQPSWLRPAALSAFLALALLQLRAGHNRGGVRWLSDAKARWRECYLRTRDIDRCQKGSDPPLYPDPAATNLQWKLDFLEQRRLNLFRGSGPPPK